VRNGAVGLRTDPEDVVSEIKIRDLARIIESEKDKLLEDPTLGPVVVHSEVEEKLPLDLEEVTFTVQGNAEVAVLNSKDDVETKTGRPKDPVFGPLSERDDLELGPQLEFDPGKAWIRYRVGVAAEGAAGGSSGSTSFSLGVGGGAELASYRIHRRNDRFGPAVLNDLTSPRFALLADHVRRLAIGEAVSFKASGKLSGKVSVSWSDALTGGLSLLTDLLGSDQTIGLEIETGLSASVALTIEDGFWLTFSRPGQNRIRIGIRKADERDLSAAVAAKVSAEFADPAGVEKVLDRVYRGLFGKTESAIDRVLSKVTLTASEGELVELIARRLGLEEAIDKLEAVKQKWENWKSKVAATIEKIAEAKVELGFGYEYSRIRTDVTVLQFLVERSKIDTYHGKLIRGDLGQALEDLRTGKASLTPERFLNQRTLKITRAWGFTLGIGDFAIAGKDRKEIEQVTRRNLEGEQKISFGGLREYEGRLLGLQKWYTDFEADMPRFAARPTLSDFEYGLSLTCHWEEKKLSATEARSFVDHALMWRAVATGDRDEILQELRDRLRGWRNMEFRIEIKLDDPAVRALLRRLDDEPEKRFGKALGIAMPPGGKSDLRRDPWLRRRFYGDLWERYLRHDHLTSSDMALHAGAKARYWGYAGEATSEREKRFMWTLGGMIERTADEDRDGMTTRRRYRELMIGLRDLRSGIERGAGPEALRPIFDSLCRFWEQSHHVRAFGAYVLDAVRDEGSPAKDGVQRVFTVTYTNEKGKEVQWEITVS
jgi:hypothetical protein